MGKLKRFLNKDLLPVSALLGMGLKLGPVPILDEIGLIIYSLVHIESPLRSRVSIYSLTLIDFALVYLAGFICTYNINTLRFILIAGLLFLYGDIGNRISSGKIIITVSFVFLISNILIPIYGIYYGLDFAWWQQGLWTGTAYASIGIFVAAMVIVVISNKTFTAFIGLSMMYYAGLLTNSRFTLFLLFLVVFVFGLRIKKELLPEVLPKKIIIIAIKLILMISLVFGVSKLSQIGYHHSQPTQLNVLSDTIRGIALEENSRDWDRKAFNRIVFTLTSNDLLLSLIGSGGLSHQIDMGDYIRRSADGRVRPVGFPAIVFDGGWLFFILILACSLKTIYEISRKYSHHPLHVKIAAISFPFVGLLSIFVTNSLDAVLFWLMIRPMGLSKYLIQCWQYKFSSNLE